MPRRDAREQREPSLDLSVDEEKTLKHSCAKISGILLKQGPDYDTTWTRLGLNQKQNAGEKVLEDLQHSSSLLEKLSSYRYTYAFIEPIYNQKRRDRRKANFINAVQRLTSNPSATKSSQGGKSEETEE
ncbi:MAG: hypothetical protein M1835_002469 [Candelina submexicana]|nr:MAG: hypothetical protein M1835_002469 [Candelina submexicana]